MTDKKMRAAGKAAIINEKGFILVIKRAGDETHLENLWDVPGGRFDYGEKPGEGLKREIKEEAGLEVDIIEPVKSWTFMRENGEQVFGTTFLCQLEGLKVELGDEHTDYQWIEKEELNSLAMHDELREGLKQAHENWRENQELPKLVRDRIPEIIKENEEEAEIRQVKGPKLERFLREKVLEEAEEFAEEGEDKELADLLEVVEAYRESEDLSEDELEKLREEKNRERGGFSEGFVLEDVE